MEIIGTGFLARRLRPLADRHEDTIALAAGVSWASGTAAADFARESALLAEVITKCASSGRRLLFFSTAATGMYGAVHGPGREDSLITPCTPYGAHKLALEGQLEESNADYLVLRLGHLVGPGQPAHQLLPALVRQMRQGIVQIHRGAARDLIDVADVVKIIDALLALGLRGETVNVASGEAVPVSRIVDHLERSFGLTVRRDYRSSGNEHVIAVDKLKSLVREVADMGFSPTYYQRVLDRFTIAAGKSRTSAEPGQE